MGAERDTEFLAPSASADEVLESEWSPAVRRRVVVGSLMAAVVLVAGTWVVRHGSAPHRPPALAPSPASTPRIGGLAAAEQGDTHTAIFLDDRFFVARGAELDAISAAGAKTVVARVSDASAGYRLLADPGRHRLWLVRLGGPTTLVVEVSTAGPDEVGRVELAGGTADAAVLSGVLYLTTTHGVLRMSSAPGRVDSLGGVRAGRAIAADPARARILLLDVPGGDVRGVRVDVPGGSRTTGPAMSLGRGDLVTVAGRIWAAGFTPDGAVLVRIDPRTLAPAGHSPVESRLGLGAVIAATGSRVLLVRGSDGDDDLWCVDGRSGALLQSWRHVAGAVVFGPGGGVYALRPGAAARPVGGRHCRG